MGDEIISFMDIVSTKMAKTIATNVSMNCNTKKIRDCYILHTVLLVIKLLLIITIICYYDTQHNKKTLMHYQYKNGEE